MAHQIGPSSCQPPFAASDKTGLSVVLMWGSFAYRAKRCLAVMMVMVVVMMMMVAVMVVFDHHNLRVGRIGQREAEK